MEDALKSIFLLNKNKNHNSYKSIKNINLVNLVFLILNPKPQQESNLS